jgi:PAS domain S-box-containing protein
MARHTFIIWVSVGFALSLALPILGSAISQTFLPDWLGEHLPLHSLVEAVGGLMAVAIAAILIAERPRQRDADHFIWMSCALIGMGGLDLFHAAVHPGQNFVWLHSTATFAGGLLFALVWLPKRLSRLQVAGWLPWVVLVATVAFGLLSCLATQIPRMLSAEGEFTLLARALNIGGGLGFLAAGVYFIRRFHQHAQKSDWLFAVHTMLFGTAGVLFEFSVLWNAEWWWWHLLRIVAYLAALVYAVQTFLEAEQLLLASHQDLTERNQQLDQMVDDRTAKLRISEERYELSVRGSTDGLWDWNLLTDEVSYADRFKELLGFAGDEFPDRYATFESHLHPDDIDHVTTAIQAHLRDRVPYDVQYRLRTKSGEYRWFRARGQAIWTDTGQPTRMAGSITDITAQRQAETQLQRERFLFRTLMENLPDVIYFKDIDGRFIRVAASLVKRLGATDATEVLGKTDADFLPAKLAAQTRAEEQRLIEGGQPILRKEEQAAWDHSDDTWLLTTKIPVRDEHEQIIGTLGISHDITEQKLAQERFRRLIEATPSAMVVVDSEGKIQLVNAATEKMFGYSRGELLGQRVEILVPQAVRSQHIQHRHQFAKRPEDRIVVTDRKLTAVRKDGRELAVEIGLTPITLDGKALVLSSIYDLTAHMRAEQALIAAKETAESANRAKSDFLANMSHEIRTPMNAVIGMTELVLDSQINQTQRNYLNIVLESAESLLSIINEILDFSKIEAGRLEFESIEFDLYEELGDTLKTLALRAHSKHIELAWHIEPNVPRYLVGDPTRLRQVLVNLVGNAIKFTEQGEVVVTVRNNSIEDDQVTLQLTVRDTGIGIPAEKMEQIFVPFEQVDTSTTREFGGTGLGLSITSYLIRAMQGRIWVESQPGQGSQFHFLAQFGIGTKQDASPTEAADLSGLSVLVVDDNATNRLILANLLDGWGMNVLVAESAGEAIELLEQCSAQGESLPLLLSDVQMPHEDGFMLAKKLRSDPRFKEIKIVLLTSAGRPGDAERSKQLGISVHMMKPVKRSELHDALTHVCGRQPQLSVPPQSAAEATAMRPLKILLAEDGKANQVLAMGLLKRWGHQVDVAEDGQQALELTANNRFDLVLMDVQMPVMDGLEATRQIRERERETGAHLPIVAMTARAMKGDRQECIDAGMDQYVAKPIRKQELAAVLSQLFDADGAPAPTEATPLPGRVEKDSGSSLR